MYTKKTFWAGLGERAVKTAAQTLAASLTLGTVLWGVDWAQAIGVTATATLLSVLTSLADPRAADTAVATGTGTEGTGTGR
jgi:holin